MPAVPWTDIIFWVLIAAWVVLGMLAAGHAVIHKRDPRSAALWVILGLALPIVGPWSYFGFGINRVQRKAMKRVARAVRKGRAGRTLGGTSRGESEAAAKDFDVLAHLAPVRTVADRVTRLPLVAGNDLVPLHSGEQAYPAMLRAIGSAEKTVTLCSYIFDWDELGQKFTDALMRAALRGVRVHVLVDGVGALQSFSRMGRRLLKSGANVKAFFPLRLPFGRVRLNLRNHRKIMVVDGRTAFTGGMNISRKHFIRRRDPQREEDLHFRVTGPIVAQIQQTFVEDWFMATDEELGGELYFPELARTGSAVCRGVVGGPDEKFETIQWIMLAALAAAERSVWLVTPYFVPPPVLMSAMCIAAMRGVEIHLILPSVVDIGFMRWVADAFLGELLEHGVRVYRRPPPFVHTKLMIVDDRLVMLGSANFDPRSLRLNFEFNVEVYDVDLAAKLAGWLAGLLGGCEAVTLETLADRSRWCRLRDGLFKLLSPNL